MFEQKCLELGSKEETNGSSITHLASKAHCKSNEKDESPSREEMLLKGIKSYEKRVRRHKRTISHPKRKVSGNIQFTECMDHDTHKEDREELQEQKDQFLNRIHLRRPKVRFIS